MRAHEQQTSFREKVLMGTFLLLAIWAPDAADKKVTALVTSLNVESEADTIPDLHAARYAELPLVPERGDCR